MINPSKLHHTFYFQFVNDSCLKKVLEKIGLERLKKSQEPHFNDIPYHEWHRLGVDADQLKLMKTCGMEFSLSNVVCVNKAAARYLVEK